MYRQRSFLNMEFFQGNEVISSHLSSIGWGHGITLGQVCSGARHHWQVKEVPHWWENILIISACFRFPSTILVLRWWYCLPCLGSIRHFPPRKYETWNLHQFYHWFHDEYTEFVKILRTRASFTFSPKNVLVFHTANCSIVFNVSQWTPIFMGAKNMAETILTWNQHFSMSLSFSVNRWWW